jgi:hypothetical protein
VGQLKWKRGEIKGALDILFHEIKELDLGCELLKRFEK